MFYLYWKLIFLFCINYVIFEIIRYVLVCKIDKKNCLNIVSKNNFDFSYVEYIFLVGKCCVLICFYVIKWF